MRLRRTRHGGRTILTRTKALVRSQLIGWSSSRLALEYLGSNQSRRNPPPYNVIKLSVGVAWAWGKASMAILTRNSKGDVIGMWYNNYECALVMAVELLVIQKGFVVSNNFSRCQFQVENDCKIVVEVPLEIIPCPY